MRWSDLVDRAMDLVEARPALAAVPLRRTDEIREVIVPSIGWKDIATPKLDGTQYAEIQLDLWAPTYDAVLAMEEEVRLALDRRICFEADGLRIQSEYLDSRSHPDSTEGECHRSIDFRLQAVR